MHHKISAYIPIYNNSPTIESALLSVQRQRYAVEELFVVDDGSTDDSAQKAERMGVRVIKQPSNLGRGAARARAMLEAKHEFVLSCDATNVLDENFTSNSLHWFNENHVAAVFGRILQRPPATAADRWRGRHLFILPQKLHVTRKASLITYGTMARRAAVLAVGNYDVTRRHSEDSDLGGRLLKMDYDVVFDPELKLTSISKNTIPQVLERYSRWNGPNSRVPLFEYFRLLSYSIKCLAARDLRDRDMTSLAISLMCPHFQFWRAYSVPAEKNKK